MNAMDTMDLLNEVESTLPVSAWTMDGVPIWPLARTRLWWSINDSYQHARYDARADHPVRRRVRQAGQLPADLVRRVAFRGLDRTHEAALRDDADILVLGDNVSRIWIDGSWYDRFCEPIIAGLSELGLQSLHLEPFHLYRRPRHNRSANIQTALDRLWLKSRLTRQSSLPTASLPCHADLIALLDAQSLDSSVVGLEPLVRDGWLVRLQATWFGDLLDTIGARGAAFVDSSLPQFALCVATRERGLPSVELQHGQQGELNRAYGRWVNIPPDGYAVMPRYFWVWTDSDADVIRAWSSQAPGHHEPVVGGNPWLELWRDGTDPLIERHDRLVEGLKGDAPTVLVALQYGNTSPADLEPFRRAIRDAPPGWVWWVRLHPAMSATDLQRVHAAFPGRAPSVLVREPSELPIQALLRHADVVATINSSTILEAEVLGVPSVSTGDDAAAMYGAQIQAGWLRPITPDGDLVQAIAAQIERAPRLIPTQRGTRDPKLTLAKIFGI